MPGAGQTSLPCTPHSRGSVPGMRGGSPINMPGLVDSKQGRINDKFINWIF